MIYWASSIGVHTLIYSLKAIPVISGIILALVPWNLVESWTWPVTLLVSLSVMELVHYIKHFIKHRKLNKESMNGIPMTKEERQVLYKRVFDQLGPNEKFLFSGWFLIVDKKTKHRRQLLPDEISTYIGLEDAKRYEANSINYS
jgi:hypothetical protein